MSSDDGGDEFEAQLELPLPNKRIAEIAFDALRVDKEPSRSKTNRELIVENSILKVKFKSTDLKNLRVSINSFFEHLILMSETVQLFGPPYSEKYSYYTHNC